MSRIKQLVKDAPDMPIGAIRLELEWLFEKQSTISYVSSVYKPQVHRKLALLIMGNLSNIRNLFYKKLKSIEESAFTDKQVVNEEFTYNANFEVAKALSNFIDLMSATNINPDDIKNYYETILTALKLDDAFMFDSTLATAIQYGRYCNIQDHVYNNPEVNLRPSVRTFDLVDSFNRGCRIVNHGYLTILDKSLLDNSFSLIEAYKVLPKSIEGNFDPYQNWVMESWLQFIKLIDLLGLDVDALCRVYSVYYFDKTIKTENKNGKQ